MIGKFDKKIVKEREKHEHELQRIIKDCRGQTEKIISDYNSKLSGHLVRVQTEFESMQAEWASQIELMKREFERIERIQTEAVKSVTEKESLYKKQVAGLLGAFNEFSKKNF